MGYRGLLAVLLVFGCANAQISRVCVPASDTARCQNINREGLPVSCVPTGSRVECANMIARGAADVGFFTEEEVLLLAQMTSTSDLRVLASVRDAVRQEAVAFESVIVVPNNHTNGYEGLRGGRYCHPGLGVPDIRWSPRVLRALEVAAARTDRCEQNTDGRTAEELEVEILNGFFSAACRPGPWSSNSTVDADLKARFPNLCAMCTAPGTCAGYDMSTAVNVAGVLNSNRHIQALECIRTNGTVAYVAWQHVREFFTIRNPEAASGFSVLCENGTLIGLTPDVLNTATAPCALVRQPWSAIVSTATQATSLAANIRTWWPQGADPGGNTWQSNAFQVLAGGTNARLFFEDTPQTPLNYTSQARTISPIDSTTSCLPARRWCTVSSQEQNKCQWVRAASHTLGLQPPISCQQRSSVFDCLSDVMESRVDFFALDSHYGYLARRHYQLSAVKLVENNRGYTSRVAALVKENNIGNISRFGNLKDGVACFPEYGSLAFVAFLRVAHQLKVISDTECNYGRAVGEFFSGACAPGAIYNSHSITAGDSEFSNTVLCTACRSAPPANANFTCAANFTNAFFGNNGSLSCLNAAHTNVAIVELQDITAQLQTLGIQANTFRVLCQNDTLALNPGVNGIDDNCLLTHVVDAEVLTRRTDPMRNSINTFLDALEDHFGYGASEQHINFHLFSPFDGVSDLLFKDSTIGLAETTELSYAPARNYMELFAHLEACTSAAPPPIGPGPGSIGHATRNLVSLVTLVMMGAMAKFVVY